MARTLGAGGLVAVAALLGAPGAIDGEEAESSGSPGAALVVRAVRPDAQLARVLALFEGERVGHPAAALAAWRRATGRHEGLSKATQAAIALVNPSMVRELRTLRGAEFRLGFGAPDGGDLWWNATLPADDGTIAALATAMVLTDGSPLPALDGAGVDRLGPAGAPLMARDPSGGVALASDRNVLDEALRRLRRDARGVAADPIRSLPEGAWLARLDVAGLANGADGPDGLTRRRVAGGLMALGCREVEVSAALRGETFEVVVAGLNTDGPSTGSPLDPSWLDWVPADRVAAALAIAVGESGASWDAAFAVADRIERADPARAEAAPLRARLGLVALAAGIRPEVDLWPLVRGVTACLTTDDAKEPDGALIVLHAEDDEAARRIARRVVRPLAARLGAQGRGAKVDDPSIARDEAAGRAFGRPLEVAVRGRSVLLAWGEGMLAASLEARAFADRSAGALIRSTWTDHGDVPRRAGAFWAGRLPISDLLPSLEGTAPLAALEDAPPVVWWGTADRLGTWDHIRWPGLRGLVHRTLERLPMETMPGELSEDH